MKEQLKHKHTFDLASILIENDVNVFHMNGLNISLQLEPSPVTTGGEVININQVPDNQVQTYVP